MEKIKKIWSKDKKFIIAILLIIAVILISLVFINDKTRSEPVSKTKETENKKTEIKKEDTDVNPYNVVGDYDGTYKFSLTSDNGSGYIYHSVGLVSFSNGTCKAKSFIYDDISSYNHDESYEGFCGLNENDNSIFYFNLRRRNRI